jgi:predicted phosphodiesterase
MDSVTTSIITATTSGLTAEVVKEAYKAVKQAVKKKLGISKTIDALETDPHSKKRQSQLAEELSLNNANADPELISLAQKLIEALNAVATKHKAASKFHIDAPGAQLGVIGDGTRIEGGIHYHYDGETRSKTTPHSTVSRETTDQQASEDDAVLMHILHLSDLHFGDERDALQWQSQLADDLTQELNCSRLDAVIISGDVANIADEAEYAAAKRFIEQTCEEFNVDRANLVIVPGNHDLNWDLSEEGYTPVKRKKYAGRLSKGDYIEESESVIQIRDDDLYKERFSPFSRFYEALKGVSYPLDSAQQGLIYPLKANNLLILGLNSAWRVDHHFKTRAGICDDALSLALNKIRRTPDYAGCLKFAVWHHPIGGPFDDRITDHGFMERLAQNGFSICFHGHMHKAVSELFPYDRSASGRKIEIVGAGTFGAPSDEWYPGCPLQYNLLKISSKHITVETRCRLEINGAWKPDARWTQGPGVDPLPRYTIDLMQDLKKKSP